MASSDKDNKKNPAQDKISFDIYIYLKKELKLSDKYILFVAEYVTNGFNGTEAYLNSIAKDGTSRETARVNASEILTKTNIQTAIRKIIDYWLDEKKLKLEQEIIAVLYTRAFYDPLEFVDLDGSPRVTSIDQVDQEKRHVIDGIEVKYFGKYADVKVITLKLANKERALQELGKYIELYKEHGANEISISDESMSRLHNIFRNNGQNGGNSKPKKKKVEKTF